MLYLYRRVVFGELTKDDVKAMPDISPREWAIFVPLAAVTLWMGVYPESFLAPMRGDVTTVVARLAPTKPAGDAQLAVGTPKAAAVHAPKAAVVHATDRASCRERGCQYV